ncbi:hypothetical protein IQ37_13380 [Chryseobacterium piperi]|uniref:Uncharacterized protein n=1 Tax=Chryseobacterium piperi TaxID=558152 RepID=A0A086B625_9FLAO|nr:hypothetical protein [Chryseobacterium piperi]ASW74461.1 hypothetical protein CJF12_09325 [Chryseobacterium piperi]KFF24389.1 hypothetical protein IQ37_13380 [Chryseobacterium piperi]
MKPAIFDDNLYRIHIPYRNYLEFENKLLHEDIEYWVDFEMKYPGSDTLRFYFKKNDAPAVDTLLKKHSIHATDNFKAPFDYRQDQKFFLLYIVSFIILLIAGLFILSFL